MRWIREHLKPGSVAFDIGANFGLMSLFMGKIAGPAGRVCAFEPSPANLSLLRYHCEHNRGCKIEVVEAAVSNRHLDTAPFFLLGGGLHSGNSLTFDRATVPNLDTALHAGLTEIVAETVSVDGFCADKQLVPALLKIDVEGGELYVLEGAQETLVHARPVLILAVHPWWLPEGRTVSQIQRILTEAGYEVLNQAGEPAQELVYGEYLCLPRRSSPAPS
jgi:FkbM family methyltransferase